MNPLEPPDRKHLDAAQGSPELGNHAEANEELEETSPQNRTHTDVLRVRWSL